MNDNQPEISKDILLPRMKEGYEGLEAYLESLSVEQATVPTDAAGWTVKDHVIHLAMWARGALALLMKENRIKAMGLSQWEDGDVMNEKIRQQYLDISYEEAVNSFCEAHEALESQVEAMTNEQLMRPYIFYDASFDRDAPVIWWVAGNSFQHYEEHREWIEAIVESYEPE